MLLRASEGFGSLRSAGEQRQNSRGGVVDKFKAEPEEMVFASESTFKDGIYGLYKRRGLDPDRLCRSMREEFEQNEGGKWLREYRYVVHEPSCVEYPSSKGVAPTEKEVPS